MACDLRYRTSSGWFIIYSLDREQTLRPIVTMLLTEGFTIEQNSSEVLRGALARPAKDSSVIIRKKKPIPTLLDLSREPLVHNPSEPSHLHMPSIDKIVATLKVTAPSQNTILKPWHTRQFVYLTNI